MGWLLFYHIARLTSYDYSHGYIHLYTIKCCDITTKLKNSIKDSRVHTFIKRSGFKSPSSVWVNTPLFHHMWGQWSRSEMLNQTCPRKFMMCFGEFRQYSRKMSISDMTCNKHNSDCIFPCHTEVPIWYQRQQRLFLLMPVYKNNWYFS